MGAAAGPDITTSGLVLSLDPANQKSFPGEPTTNLIPSPGLNSLPTSGNGWATYNTNQYCGNNGCAVHWDIPAIASVSSNIITTVSAHQIRSFDVITPLTTGGGVTGGANYIAKKISSTEFSLHEWNSSQDGSQGYINTATGGFKVHDSYWLDQRVSVNASSFPTKWWGSPHLPNSAIVKETITGGYVAPDLKATDCIRLHWFRSDTTDGMAYGVDASVTIGQSVTTSFYLRAASTSAVGQYIAFQHYNYGGPAGASGFYYNAFTGALGEWKRCSFTFTPTHNALISYWFPSTGDMKIDLANIQVEQKSYATRFIAGTRGTTVATGGGWRDTSGKANHVELVNGPVSPNGYTHSVVAFDGTNDYGTIPTFTSKPTTQITCEAWCKPLKGSVGTGTHRGGVISCTNSMYLGIIDSTDGGNTFSMHWANQTTNSRLFNWNGQIPNTAWSHLVGTYDGVTNRAYLNGVEIYSEAQTGTIPDGTYVVGTYGGALTDGVHNFNGLIGDARIYTQALTASQVLDNYNKTKGKYKLM